MSPTIGTIPSDLTLCTRNASEAPLKADFNLTSHKCYLGSQDRSYNILTFHSEAGANNNTAIIVPNSSNVLLSSNQTLWIRLQNISSKTAMRLQALVLCDLYW
jgi:hypothetical protein